MSFVDFIQNKCKHEKDFVRKRRLGHIEVIQCRKCKEIMSIDTKEFERWVLKKNRSDSMEIDEKNLSKHIANLMKMDILSNLTLKQARAIALSLEHQRLKAIEECAVSKKKSLVVDHAIKIDLSAVSERVRKEIDEVLNSVLAVESDLKTCDNTITCQCGLKHN